jgi:hypothetical protein
MTHRDTVRFDHRFSGLLAALIAATTACLAACGGSGSMTPATPAHATSPAARFSGASMQAPVPAESNPPGDIPDTTIFVSYQSDAPHALIKVPEGWARQSTASGTTFSSNLNSITIAAVPMAAMPTVASIRATTVRSLSGSTLAFRLQSVSAVQLPGGPAVEIVYEVNSQPNAVTGRQYRLVIERFEFYRSGQGAALSLSSAVGSDNVDPWRIVSRSFQWA